VRRKPSPNAQPGYIRIDSVHQGDQGRRKGIYHVNAVDEVTQFQVIITLERISEEFMLPALKRILAAFPFKIRGFHMDNGGEYINHTVAELLEKLRIEFTKSRPRHSNDNGLVESKQVYRYVNFHRPCYFPTEVTDAKGKQHKKYRYEDMTTPYEKFRSLSRPSQHLKPGITFKNLDTFAISGTTKARKVMESEPI
jgi:transposase InsO family protein